MRRDGLSRWHSPDLRERLRREREHGEAALRRHHFNVLKLGILEQEGIEVPGHGQTEALIGEQRLEIVGKLFNERVGRGEEDDFPTLCERGGNLQRADRRLPRTGRQHQYGGSAGLMKSSGDRLPMVPPDVRHALRAVSQPIRPERVTGIIRGWKPGERGVRDATRHRQEQRREVSWPSIASGEVSEILLIVFLDPLDTRVATISAQSQHAGEQPAGRGQVV
jgi:hypothetical protein